MKKSVYIKLGAMMFMQYMLYAVWSVPLAAYLRNLPHIDIGQAAMILGASAIGTITAPLIGVIADRYVNSEKLLAGLNILVAGFLFMATQQTQFTGLMITVTLAMLFYMPSWGLMSSIAMTHAPSEQFPRIRLLGSIGWVASGVFSIVAVYGFKVDVFDGTVLPLYCAVGIAIVAALLNLTLPKTPPPGVKTANYSVADIFGLRVIAVLKNKNFNIFILISFLAIIPFTLYNVYGSMFFADQNVKNITVTMNWGQVAELFFLFITTSILIKYGFKKALCFGLLAMLVRYLSLYASVELGQQWWFSLAILPHGLIFGLFFIAGQVYTDRLVPQEYKAQAQGFLSFVIWGAGYFVGTLVNGWLFEYTNNDWASLFLIVSAMTVVVIILLLTLFKNPSVEKPSD
jgi:nucleoside transporter